MAMSKPQDTEAKGVIKTLWYSFFLHGIGLDCSALVKLPTPNIGILIG